MPGIKINITKTLLILALMAGALFAPGFAQVAIAQASGATVETLCGGDTNTYQAFGRLDGGQYDVFLRFGRPTDTAAATIYYQPLSAENLVPGSCQKIGEGNATGKSPTKLGSLTLPAGKNSIQITVNSPAAQGGLDGGAPSVVFVPAGSAICDFAADCTVKYHDESMTLSPQKISLSSDILRLGLLSSPDQEVIKEVTYSVDNKPMYVAKKLERFNLNYVSNGKHTVQRTVLLKSGQVLRDSKYVQHGSSLDINYSVIAFVFTQLRILTIIGSLLGLLIILALVLAVARAIDRRRRWKQTHILHTEELAVGAGPRVGMRSGDTLWQVLWSYRIFFGIVTFGFVLLFLVNVYVLSVFTVDGVSMSPTLQNKSKHPLLKLPKTQANINSGVYLPKRGQIVVIQREDVSLFVDSATQSKSYVVKRVIGLPGERVVVKDSLITIYNADHEKGFVPDTTYRWMKTVPPSEGSHLDVTLKAGEIFVVGDNRPESVDSRSYGPVKADQIVGNVIL